MSVHRQQINFITIIKFKSLCIVYISTKIRIKTEFKAYINSINSINFDMETYKKNNFHTKYQF